MSDIKKGDRVRVAFEGEVTVAGDKLRINAPCHEDGFAWVDPSMAEKIEPPVEVFTRRDTVRDKRVPEFVFTVGQGGYFDHFNGKWNQRDEKYLKQYFTSENYEKIHLA